MKENADKILGLSSRLTAGKILIDNKSKNEYAIIYVSVKDVTLCARLKTKTRLLLSQLSTSVLLDGLASGRYSIMENDVPVVDESSMSQTGLANYRQKLSIIGKISDSYGPDFIGLIGKKEKPLFDEICVQYSITRATLLRTLTIWLQSGCQNASLVESRGLKKGGYSVVGKKLRGKKPTGVQEAKVLEPIDFLNMDEAIETYRQRKSHVITKKDVYIDMLTNHYTKVVVDNDGMVKKELFPIGKYPSIKQFYRYFNKKVSKKEFETIKTSNREYRNDHRALTANERVNLTYPGELCDIDATPVDIYLVSKSDPTKLVNRGHMYFIIDVLTGMIVSGSVSFEDNSNAAVSNVLVNLKKEGRDRLLDEAGVALADEAYWPSDIRPGTLRCDRGSEFVSQEFRRKCGELGITIQLVPAATGSMKGTVEKEFRHFNLANSDYFEHKGLITKRYDSDHKKTACLNISDLRKIMVSYILYHNSRAVESRQRSPEMIENNVSTSPVELWEYYSRMNGPHRFTMNINQFISSLMKPATASMTRAGIRFKGLYYLCENDIALNQFMMEDSKAKKINVRYDEASMRHIYYIRDNVIYEAVLNLSRPEQADYANMSYNAFSEYKKMEREQKKQDRQRNIQRRIEHNERLSMILSQKENSPKPESTDKIRENSKIEKETDNLEHQLSFLAKKKPDNTTNAQVQENVEEKLQQDSEPEVDERDKPIVAETEEEWREIFLKRYGYKK